MITTIKSRFLFFALLVLPAMFCLGDVPSGVIDFSFDSSSVPVWDITGDITISDQMIGTGGQIVPFSYTISVTQDSRGVLSGSSVRSGIIILNIGNDFVAANYTAKGKVSGGGDVTRISLTVNLKGEDVVAGVTTGFTLAP